MPTKLKIGVAGCGNIAGAYGKTLAPYEQIEMGGAMDLVPDRAEAFVKEYGGKAYATLEEMLADDSIDLVVNLSIHHAHYEVITQCLEAGKHVHSEKPLAMTYAEAKQLVDLAEKKKLRLSCSPFTYMGEAQQTAWKAIREGKTGPVRAVYAEVNHGRIESWHPNPGPFYDVGPLFDVGVYPLTLATTFFGPAKRVTAFGKVLYPDRVTKEGMRFKVTTPDFHIAAVELAGGQVMRLTVNFYVRSRQGGSMEFHGDAGSVYLGSFQSFNTPVEFAPFGEAYEPIPYVREPFKGTEWGRVVVEMAEAMEAGRPQRATGAQAAHVVEILEAITASAKEGRAVAVTSSFAPPAPMEWG